MKTIRQNLVEGIDLLKTKQVLNHLNACHQMYLDLSTVKGLEVVATILDHYIMFLIHLHQDTKKVGRIRKSIGIIKAFLIRNRLAKMIVQCERQNFGDGEQYIREVLQLIKKSI
jgi:hypothetical protein